MQESSFGESMLGVAPRAIRQRTARFAFSVALLFLSWLSALGFTLWHLREDALDRGADTAQTHAQHFEEQLTQSFRVIDLTAGSMGAPAVRGMDSWALARRLLELSLPIPYLRSLSVVESDGRVVASSHEANVGVLVNPGLFFPHTESGLDVLRIGLPWRGRDFSTGQSLEPGAVLDPADTYFIPVLNPVPGDGPPLWLVAAVNPDYFINQALQMIPGEQGFVQWLRHDDVRLMSSHAQHRPGFKGVALQAGLDFEASASGSASLSLDSGPETLMTYRASSQYPVVVIAHLDKAFILARWSDQALRLVLMVVPILVMLAVAVVVMWRRQQRLLKKQMELDEQRRLAASVFKSSSDAIVITTPEAKVVSVNAAFERVTGFAHGHAAGSNPKFMASGLHDRAFFQAMWHSLLAHGYWQGEIINRHRLGHLYTAQLTINVVSNAAGQALHFVGVLMDISARKAAEERLEMAASVFTHAREGIMITTPGGDLVEVNDAFSRITGYTREEAIGRNTRMLSSGRQGKDFYATMWHELQDKGRWAGEIWNRRKSGEVYVEMLTISAVRNPRGEVIRYVALFSDVSQQKEHEHRLEQIAHYDALTSLPNRVLLADRLRQAMAQTLRHKDKLALVFMDLDGFKAVNDTHGHDVGDKLLIALAARVTQALRDGDTMARIGGDEFVVVLTDLADPEAASPVLERMRVAAASPFWVDGRELQVSASLGVAFYPQVGDVDADQLLRQADQAMYQAKLSGKNRFHVFDAKQDSDIRGHHESLEAIRQGIAHQEFELYYQPKVNMRTGALVGVEALIRWNHPTRGLLLPGSFLPLLERDPLVVTLGHWVLQTALAQIRAWKAEGLTMPVSVNVDAQLLQHPDFVPHLRDLLASHPSVGPGDLELEVLETNALDDIAGVSAVMEDCRAIGVGFALDDFGTGYSSLTYLRRLPASVLKIDQSFVRDMLDNPDDLSILEGVMGLARAFRRQVIAEGVETTAHGRVLLHLGCEWGQGYAIARPMPAQDLAPWLAQWRPDPEWLDVPAANRDDLPVLFAAVEHRAWVQAIAAHLAGHRASPPELDASQCRFAHWLNQESASLRHKGASGLADIVHMHHEIHDLAAEALAFHGRGEEAQAQERLAGVFTLRDALLERLMKLLG